jgi:hypothetical protein
MSRSEDKVIRDCEIEQETLDFQSKYFRAQADALYDFEGVINKVLGISIISMMAGIFIYMFTRLDIIGILAIGFGDASIILCYLSVRISAKAGKCDNKSWQLDEESQKLWLENINRKYPRFTNLLDLPDE